MKNTYEFHIYRSNQYIGPMYVKATDKDAAWEEAAGRITLKVNSVKNADGELDKQELEKAKEYE